MIYANTEDGVKEYLRDECTLQLDYARATFRQDPSVTGVWLVQCIGGLNIVVSLAGYSDPFGNTRPDNDFETSI